MNKYMLVIDIGTQSLRAVVFDKNGNIVKLSRIIYDDPYFSKSMGYAERNVEKYWLDLVRACKYLWQNGISPNNIESVAVTTQRATTVFLDDNGNPVRPAVLWLDQRMADNVPSLGLYEIVVRLLFIYREIKYIQRRAVVNWVIENEHDIWEKTSKVLFLSSFINYKLTGDFIDSLASQVGYLPFNFKKQNWEDISSWKYRIIPVKYEMLPKLKPPGSILGYLSDDAAKEIGLSKGIPIVSTASDKACEILGCGVVESSQACLGMGTTATISVNSKKYFEIMKFSPAYPSAIPNEFNIEYQIFRGLWLITWFKDQFAELESEKAKSIGLQPEELLDKLAEKISVGSNGLISQPFWSPGVRYPGLNAKGCIIGFNDVHTKEHIYRSLIEGLMFSLREGYEFIQSKSGVEIKEVYIAGGGAKSNFVIQCAADIMNVKVKKPRYYESSSLGAAILSALALGIYSDIYSAIDEMTAVKQITRPKKDNVVLYNKIYKKVFKKVYKKLEDIYKEIDSIYEFRA